MFLRHTKRKKDGKEHRYWSIVENRRIGGGGRVVQRPLLYLGKINDLQELAWRKSIAILEEGALQPRTLSLFPEDRCEGLLPDASIVWLRLNELRLCRPRQWGGCWLALSLWRELELDGFWGGRLPPSRKGTRWDRVLLLLATYRLLAPRVMCGWPPARKDFFACRQLKVACGHVSGLWSRPVAAGPDGFRGIEALIKPAGSRCPITRDRYPSTRRLTDDAIARFHPRKSWWFKVQFLCSISEPFLRPDLISAWRRAQPRSRLAAGHRRRRRAAVLTAVSTASGSSQVGARLILPWPAIGLLAHHHRPTDARHLVGERAGGELALLGCEQFDQPGILLGSLAAQHRHGAVDEQSAQVTVAALADRTQFDLSSRPVLPRHQTERGGEVPAAAEGGGVDGDRRHGTGQDRSVAGNGDQVPASDPG